MHLRRLQVASFRSYDQLDLPLTPGSLVFLGDNAQGKSNLLEAVHLLASGSSQRAGSDAEMIARPGESESQPIARIVGSVERRAGPVQVETILVGSAPAARDSGLRAGKRFRVNGIPRRAIDLVGQLRAVLFTADDLTIITGGPAERRRFLDTMLSQLDGRYHAALGRYGRVLQQRNAVLRRIREGLAGPDELPFWDESLAREGAVLVSSRFKACSGLAMLAPAAHRDSSGPSSESLTLAYRPRLAETAFETALPSDAPALEKTLGEALLSGRRRDIAAGVTLTGPHRDDLYFEIDGAPAAAFGSRAQIRTATLALRLAEARILDEDINDPPVILLDDIVSELDGRRRRAVVDAIAGFDQVWFTATDASFFTPAFLHAAHVFQIQKGIVVEAQS